MIESPSIAMRRRRIEVREHFDGKITIKFNGRYLKFKELIPPKLAKSPKARKHVIEPVMKRSKYIPLPDHPWRRHQHSLHHN